MQKKSTARITAIGTYVPEKILTNHDLEKMVETNDEWVIQRTGIRERRIAESNQFTSDLCFAAIENMQERYPTTLADVDFIIVATSTPDFHFPSVASQIQAKFSIPMTGAIDLGAACSGFTYGLYMANALVTAGLNKKVLVIGAEVMSKVLDFTDRTTCILFGDGAGAVLVERDEEHPSFLSAHLETKGESGHHLYLTYLDKPLNVEGDRPKLGYIVQNGREVYKWAVSNVPRGMKNVALKAGMELDQVDWFVPHNANLRMIESICERSGYPIERLLQSLELHGNTSAASVPLALDTGVRDGRVKQGDNVLLYGFGAGLTHVGVLVEWSI